MLEPRILVLAPQQEQEQDYKFHLDRPRCTYCGQFVNPFSEDVRHHETYVHMSIAEEEFWHLDCDNKHGKQYQTLIESRQEFYNTSFQKSLDLPFDLNNK